MKKSRQRKGKKGRETETERRKKERRGKKKSEEEFTGLKREKWTQLFWNRGAQLSTNGKEVNNESVCDLVACKLSKRLREILRVRDFQNGGSPSCQWKTRREITRELLLYSSPKAYGAFSPGESFLFGEGKQGGTERRAAGVI